MSERYVHQGEWFLVGLLFLLLISVIGFGLRGEIRDLQHRVGQLESGVRR